MKLFPGIGIRYLRMNLKQTEWIFVTTILLLMASLVIIGRINGKKTSSILENYPLASHEKCKVKIEGAVAKPGIYHVLPGTPLKTIIKKSSPTPYADLKKICMDQRIEHALNIQIDPLTEISVTINGKQITVPAGTKVCQLKKYIDVSDHKIFKSRRFLKDQEVINSDEVY
jgi:hypothetical protein